MTRKIRRLLLAGTAIAAAALVGLSSCALLAPLPEPTTLDQRLASLPRGDLPLSAPVRVSWDDHQVPWIEAATDRDLAFALGLVHAHLRMGQMELMRRISQGRISEMAGPLAVDVDKSLRILGFGRAVPEVIANMPEDTRRFGERFVDGINHWLAQAETLPHEFEVLGLDREPWTLADVLTIGRMASTDVNWLVWFRMLRLRDRPDWPELWARAVAEGSNSILSYGPDERAGLRQDLLAGLSKSGSNAVAVADWRSASGGALIASDPHLGLFLPNLWLIAGMKSPSYHMVGLMVPGLPFVALGRNPHIAWGGTNLRAASSDLFDASDLPMTESTETIQVRWWFDDTVTVRQTPLGPVISDAPVLETGDGPPLALSWMGHRPTDELSAMLGVNRARDWDGFVAALEDFAISAQNMLYADAEGNIGQVMAARLPRRPLEPPADVVLAPEAAAAWDETVTVGDLPMAYDPPDGFLASANNQGAAAAVPIGWFFSANDRIRRLEDLLAAESPVTVDDLVALQGDTYQISSAELRDVLVARAARLDLPPEQARLVARLRDWDGRYDVDSVGPVIFEPLLARLLADFYTEDERAALGTGGRLPDVLLRDLPGIPDARLAPSLAAGLETAAEVLAEYGSWGEMHRLRMGHPLSNLPVLGGRYDLVDLPVGGSRGTLMKTHNNPTAERHKARYGSNARHISDLAEPDRNWFVLLGGQDGWLNSANFADQIDLWRAGAYIQVPLEPETVRRTFPHRVELKPAPDA